MNSRETVRDFFVTAVLIAVNIVIFLFMYITGHPENASYMAAHGASYPPLIEDGEYYRLFTAMFLHFDMNHLLSNMLLLGAAGHYLEDALGHIKYALLYLAAGLGGSVLSYASMQSSGDYAVSAGASGAIFGLVGGLLWIVWQHRGHYERLTGKGMLGMILLAMYTGMATEHIDNMAHLGGLLTGFIMAVILYRRKQNTSADSCDMMDETNSTPGGNLR